MSWRWAVGAGRQLQFDGKPVCHLDSSGNDPRAIPHVTIDGLANLLASLLNEEGATLESIYEAHMGHPRKAR